MFGIFLYTLLLSVLVNLAIFAVAYKRRTDKLTDISYALTFIILAVIATLQSSHQRLNYLAFLMVLVWSTRLGGFLLYRVSKTGRDSRFDETRNNFLKFLRFWFFQGLTVWILMIPIIALSQSNPAISLVGVLGIAIWLMGFLIESFADYQKFKFTQISSNKNKWINSGLWAYSRHPNYFGEILVWTGIYVTIVQSLSPTMAIIALASPLYITALLLFVSGVPILEKGADKKWGDNKDYLSYKQATSILIPLTKRN